MSHDREIDPNDITRIPFTIGLRSSEGIKLRQAIKRAMALGKAKSEGEAIMLFVDAWLMGDGRRIR